MAWKLCCGCFSTFLVFLVVLMLCSFGSLEYNQIGLDYSSISKTIDRNYYTSGIYFLGLGHSFLTFPKSVQTIEFSHESGSDGAALESRTDDGLEVVLELSFQYRFLPEKMFDLYHKYGDSYQTICENVAIDCLTAGATHYTAYDFFTKRGEIGRAMQLNLTSVYSEHCYGDVDFFQLRQVDLPDPFEAAIRQTEVKKQDINKAYAEKQKVSVEIRTNIEVAQYQQNVTINLAQGEAQSTLERVNGTVAGFNVTQTAQTGAYAQFKEALEMDNSDFLQYLKAKLIKDYTGTAMTINLSDLD